MVGKWISLLLFCVWIFHKFKVINKFRANFSLIQSNTRLHIRIFAKLTIFGAFSGLKPNINSIVEHRSNQSSVNCQGSLFDWMMSHSFKQIQSSWSFLESWCEVFCEWERLVKIDPEVFVWFCIRKWVMSILDVYWSIFCTLFCSFLHIGDKVVFFQPVGYSTKVFWLL